MGKSSKTTLKDKPEKPRSDFPLFPHAVGQWAKKVRGRMRYFGPWHDPAAAEKLWDEQKEDLLAGREPRPKSLKAGLTLRNLANEYLTHKQQLRDTGEITARTFQDCYTACERVLNVLGRDRDVEGLQAADFGKVRATLAKTLRPLSLGIEIQRIRSIFKFGLDSVLFTGPVRYGQSFEKPSKKVIRAASHAKGPRTFTADELRTIIDAAPPQLKAMILLGINCGMGNHDIALLPVKALDLENGWIHYPRQKTAIPRDLPLWDETSRALGAVLAKRPEPKDKAVADLVFLTRLGVCWVKHSKGDKGAWTDSIGLAFGKLLRELKLKRKGIGFYALRHTFRTVGDECRDQPAVDFLMGHAAESDDMAANYRHGISDERLRAVTETVHQWLFPPAAKRPKPRSQK